MQFDEDNYDDDLPQEKTRGQLKRESEELQALGERLITLKTEDLNAFSLPERLQDAIELAKRITSHGGQRRQRQYIGRLMRDIDVVPIRQEFERLDNRQRNQTKQLHELETWRTRLIDDVAGTMDQLIAQFPNMDANHLRHLIRQAQQEKKTGGTPKASRLLLRYLREIMNAAA